jgi:hypothetical protein
MAMNELRKEVEAAAMAELNRANAKFPLFNSTHEGYAVILEEAEEAQEAMENVKTSLAVLWDRVKGIEVACFLDEDTTPTATKSFFGRAGQGVTWKRRWNGATARA